MRIPVVLQDREHGFQNLLQKRIRTRFAQGSHSCEIRTEILGKDREHAFLKIGTKMNSHKVRILVKFALRFWEGTESMLLKICHKREFAQGDVLCENFAQREWVVRILLCLGFFPLFSLVFTLTSFFKLSYLHVNTKKPIQTTLE